MTDENLRQVRVFAPDWEHLRFATVKLWQEQGGSVELALKADEPVAEWRRIAGEPYSYDVTFVDGSGQVIEGAEGRSDSETLVIPPPFQDQLTGVVRLSPVYERVGAELLIAIRYHDEENAYRFQCVFHLRPGDSEYWRIPIIDPDLRTYRYHATLILEGAERKSGWVESDEPTLFFGPKEVMNVQVVTLISPVNTLAKISLAFEGEGGEQRRELVARPPFDNDFRWTFFPESADARTYRYQVTVYDEDAVPHEQPEATTSDEVLIARGPDEPSSDGPS